MLLVDGSSETGLLRHISDDVFGGRNFGNTKSMRAIFFMKYLNFFSRFQKCRKKVRKGFFVSDIIPSELVSLNCLE